MVLIGFLILAPLAFAALLLAVRNNKARKVVVCAGAAVIAAASLVLVFLGTGTYGLMFRFYSPVVDYVCMGLSVLIAACILYFGVRYKNVPAIVLALVQVIGSLIFELAFAHSIVITECLYVDSLSLVMTFIIGVIGTGICVYALGYMDDFQAHEPEGAPDRRPMFFALMFAFLSAMYLIVFSNNMLWFFTGWEITTLCSFLLIGYTRTPEAIANAFRQIVINLIGGIAFLEALYAMAITFGTLSLNELIVLGQLNPQLASLPLCALAIAGMENFPVFRKTILEGAAPVMDTDAVGAEIGAAAAAMTDGQPLDALLLECTDLSVFARTVQEAVSVPVYDINSLIAYAAFCVRRNQWV